MNEELQIEMVPGHWSAELGRNVTFADLLAVAGFDAEDRPAPGTECAQCRMFGHWCPAKGFCGIYTLCLPCGAGEACEQLAAVDRMQRGVESELFEVEKGYQASECRSIAIPDEDRIVVERKPVESAWLIKASLDPENLKKGLKKNARVPLAQKVREPRVRAQRPAKVKVERVKVSRPVAAKLPAAKVEEMLIMELDVAKAHVLNSFPAISINQLAKETGHSYYLVHKWLVDAGLHQVGAKVAVKPKKTKPAAKAIALAPVVEVADETVSVKVSVKVLDKLILMLPAKMKASAIEKLLAELA